MMRSRLQEKACEEQTSFDLTPYDLASAIDVVNRLLVEQARDVGRQEALTETFSDESSSGGSRSSPPTLGCKLFIHNISTA